MAQNEELQDLYDVACFLEANQSFQEYKEPESIGDLVDSVVNFGPESGDDSYLGLKEHIEDIAPELLEVKFDEFEEHLALLEEGSSENSDYQSTQEAISLIIEEANKIREGLISEREDF